MNNDDIERKIKHKKLFGRFETPPPTKIFMPKKQYNRGKNRKLIEKGLQDYEDFDEDETYASTI